MGPSVPARLVLVALAVLVLAPGCTQPAGSTAASGIQGRAMVGPTCPVQRDPPDPSCADCPFHGTLAIIAADGSVAATPATDDAGNFTAAVAPGTYTIRDPEGAPSLPRCSSPGSITVVAGAYTKVEVACDSGIR